MKIKMLTSVAGVGFALSPGEETDRFPEGEARRMIEAGYAVPIADERRETTTRKPAPEKRG